MVDMKLSFDPMTIEHLGFKMYSHLPNAVAELVANSYDADATTVSVVVHRGAEESVEVIDDGHGMSDDDLADKYLRIGRNRRIGEGGVSESGRRRVAGRKGLGKLALFGIGDRVTVRTKREGAAQWTVVVLEWPALKAATGGDYRPTTTHEPGEADECGTSVLVEQLRRKTAVSPDALARSLARLFQHTEAGFALEVRAGSERYPVTRKLRYSTIEVETRWAVPEEVAEGKEFAESHGIRGEVIASVRPLPAEMRGITLYVHGRLANEPEYYGVPESSYAFSYLTGHVEADYVDDLDEDLIATDRRSISWETVEGEALRVYLNRLLRAVADLRRTTRRLKKRERLKTELGVDSDEWPATMRGPEAEPMRGVLERLTSPDSEISDDDRAGLVEGLRKIAPEYADLHWRNLHSSIQAAAGDLYRGQHYFHAVLEAIKAYVNDVRLLSGVEGFDLNAIHQAFGKNHRLDVFTPYIEHGLSEATGENLRLGQHELSQGLWAGFRNPLSHEQVAKLEECGAFTYQDCLDALSILSHLRRRLDGATRTDESAESAG